MIKCPHCGESYYRENYTTSTLIGWSPVYRDGILINADSNPNSSTIHCTCLNCHKEFSYNTRELANEDNIRPV